MGVSSTARLPSLGAQSIPPLFSHLQHTSNAKVVARWSITIRSFRAVPVPANAWPSPDQYDSSFSLHTPSADAGPEANSVNAGSSSSFSNVAGSAAGASSGAGGSGSSSSGAPPLTKPRTMWQVWLSDHPGVVFVIVEDTGRSSRAKVWRDWEVATKKWKKDKRREIEAKRKREEKAQQDKEKTKVRVKDLETSGSTTGIEGGQEGLDDKPAPQTEGDALSGDKAEPMDVDTVTSGDTSSSAQAGPAVPPTLASSGAPAEEQKTEAAPSTTITAQEVQDIDEEPIEEAGPKPKLRLPSHTRYTVSALTSSMSSMLTGLNLPPPHGAPVGTAGPGAWVPRGAAVSIEGLVLEINSQSLNVLPGISPALASVSSTDDAATFSTNNGKGTSGVGGSAGAVDWRVRVGSVMGGGGRSAGAIVEAEFLPVSTLLPTSKFMHDFLHSLFPPGLVPLPAPATGAAPGMANLRSGGVTASASTNGTPRMANNAASLAAANTNTAPTAGSSFNYTIGGAATTAPPNRNFNIPLVSDQLWEEVVPRSGEGWRRRILKRSLRMKVASRALRRERRKAASALSVEKGESNKDLAKPANGHVNPFGWHTFGSDDEISLPISTQPNSEWQDTEELSSSDSESEPVLPTTTTSATGGLTGTAVTMQPIDDEDDDDDDDRPLGAPIWTNTNPARSMPNSANSLPASASASAPATEQTPKKEENSVQLIFQGLRPDDNDSEVQGDDGDAEDGWTGIERGRRIAFQYVQMLRAEGII
ncbi:uncharacterized protein UTRI_01688 [Ustilago trichophora]|uniref:Uncharacterized protein n=1 Tax=Ustilago trichophora TaxID=86804 RepID=A0A5C3DZB0_9BASI|nr:uncharacterized protein UTRI_01688 [Ustilago trichophora]